MFLLGQFRRVNIWCLQSCWMRKPVCELSTLLRTNSPATIVHPALLDEEMNLALAKTYSF